MQIKTIKRLLIMTLLASILSACAGNQLAPIPPVAQVDLPKFMGDWYVLAVIPTMIETEAYNAIENYRLDSDGTIATTFTFNKSSLDGEAKTYRPRGFVVDGTGNALWGMQFIWPIKAEFIIAYLDAAYTQTIIARSARDYVWIMARTPTVSAAEYSKLTDIVANMGYDLSKLRKVPHNAAQ